MVGLWRLIPLSTIFQLYRGGQFYWWGELQYPQKTTDLSQVIKIVSIFLGRDMSGTTFIGSKLVSFNQTFVPDDISKVSFQCAEKKILVSMSEEI
jgi:hypothetical protein